MGAASSCFGGDKPAQTSAQDKSLAVTRTQSRGGGGAGNTHLHVRFPPPLPLLLPANVTL